MNIAELSRVELRDAGTIAKVWLMIDDARRHGFIDECPPVDLDRCKGILTICRARNVELPYIDSDEFKFAMQDVVSGAPRPHNFAESSPA